MISNIYQLYRKPNIEYLMAIVEMFDKVEIKKDRLTLEIFYSWCLIRYEGEELHYFEFSHVGIAKALATMKKLTAMSKLEQAEYVRAQP